MIVAQPLYLMLLLLLPLIPLAAVWWWKRYTVRVARLSRHAVGVPARAKLQVALLTIGAGMLILALSGPAWGRGEEEAVQRSRNLMLAVDVSRSMLAEDVRPNRLSRAKADLIDLVDALNGDRAGLLAFRGKGVLLCPMTTDVAFLRQNLDALAPDSAPPGETDLADAIEKCLAAFEMAQSAHNAIVLVSDGEDLAGRAKQLATVAGERGIPIFTVGIGSAKGAVIPDGASVVKYEGEAVKSQLTESTLREIAEASHGRYIPLATAGTAQTTLGAVYARYLSKLADEEVREHSEVLFVNRTWIFAVLAAGCCLMAGILSLGRIRCGRFLLIATLFGAGALGAKEPARQAQSHYRAGRFQEAAAAYAEARNGAEASELAHYAYNEALALWKAGDITNALDRVQMAVGDKAFTGRAATLEGALQMVFAERALDVEARLEHRVAAADAFSRALLAEPSQAAERNLSRALEGMDALKAEARKAAALKRYKDVPLQQLLPQILQHQRDLFRAVPEVYGSSDASVILSQAEQLAKDVAEQHDRWYPVLEQLPQAITNETACLELLQHAQAAQDLLDRAAKRYEALDRNAKPLIDGEPMAYDFWKLVAQPDALIGEAIAVQTNAMTSLTSYQPTREDQPEVLNLVQQFRVLFPKWADDYLRQQAASTNEVTFTEEARDQIARTADATVPLLSSQMTPETKQQVMDNLILIRDLLPKISNQQSQDQRQKPQEQDQQEKQQQDQQQQDQSQQQQDPQEAQTEETEKQDEAKDNLEALLQKAADREREHEEEKRKRAVQRMSPTARDW